MPLVPRRNARGGGLGGVTRVRHSAADHGGQEAAALTNLGTAVANVGGQAIDHATEIEERHNRTEAERIRLETQRELNDLQDLYRQDQGKNAVDRHGEYLKELERIQSSASVKSPRQQVKDMVEFVVAGDVEAQRADLTRHVSKQQTAYEIQTKRSILDMAVKNAVRNKDNMNALAHELGDANAAIDQLSEMYGWDADTVGLAKLEQSTKMHEAIINNHIANGDLQAAMEHFEMFHEDGIDPERWDSLVLKVSKSNEVSATVAYKEAGRVMKFMDEFNRAPDEFASTLATLQSVGTPTAQDWARQLILRQEAVDRVNDVTAANSLADQEAILSEEKSIASSTIELGYVSALEDHIHATRKAVKNGTYLDLLSDRGHAPSQFSPLEMGNLTRETLTDRASVVDRESEALGVDIDFFTASEQAKFNAGYEAMDIVKRVKTIGRLKENTSPAHFKSVLRGLSADSGSMAVAAEKAVYDPKQAVAIMDGMATQKQNKEFNPKPALVAAQKKKLARTFPMSPEIIAPMSDAAEALYVHNRAKGNNSYTMDDAVNELFPTVTHNGNTVLRPTSMDDGEWVTFTEGLTTDRLTELGNGTPQYEDGTPFDAELLNPGFFDFFGTSAQLVTRGTNQYAIVVEGLGFVRTEDGKVYTLTVED